MTVCFGAGADDLIRGCGARTLATCQVCLFAGSLVPRELLAARYDHHRRPELSSARRTLVKVWPSFITTPASVDASRAVSSGQRARQEVSTSLRGLGARHDAAKRYCE